MPLDGSASVEPQMEHEIVVEALSKIVHSLPQSRQLTFRNRPLITHTCHLSTSSNFLARFPLGE